VDVSPAIPSEVYAGSNVGMTVSVSCASGCDLRGGRVKIVDADRVLMTSELADFDGSSNATRESVVGIPEQPGDHSWNVEFEGAETGDIAHEGSVMPVVFSAKPHDTSMIVWSRPAPVAIGSRFEVRVGVRCSAGCDLTGQLVEIRDHAGSPVGEGRLGSTPWPGTESLYVGDVSLPAPATEGVSSWSALFAADGLHLPHEGASAIFGFRTARPPEHTVVVKVVEEGTEAPLVDIEVHVGLFYRASTDAQGMAKVELPKGTYEVKIRKRGYEALPMALEVVEDIAVRVSAHPVQERDPDDDAWM
jgi:hypothetical protein